jgi:hypothetical protein
LAEVVLSTEDLLVLGGPEQIDVQIDFGPQGDRGSLIYASVGNPNEALTIEGINPKDLCINILQTDDNYSYLYQYNAGINGIYQWYPLIKLNPNQYHANLSGTFVDGEKTFNIPVVNIVDLSTAETLTSSNFNINLNIQNEYPVATSFQVGSLITDPETDTYVLPITVNAVYFDGSDWLDLSGLKSVHFSISIVV